MRTITLSAILEDLQAIDQSLRRFEQRYWLSSRQFYELYAQGSLDDGEHSEEFSEWAGLYKLKQKREQSLEKLSQERLARLPRKIGTNLIEIAPAEPALNIP
jgi:hypothetical protein